MKLSKCEKLSYALVNLGNMPIMTLITTYLLIFYTNVCGMNPAAVATLFLIARFADALNDPFFGYIIDHAKIRKMGKFRPILLVSSIAGGLNYLLLWYGPLLAPTAKLLIAYITYLLLGITFTIMDISVNSLLPVITDDRKERNNLAAIKGVVLMIGAMVLSIAAPLIIEQASSQKKGYMLVIGIATAIVIICSCAGVLGVKERVIKKSNHQYDFKELLNVFISEPILITFIASLCYSFGSNMFSAAGTYFYTHVFGSLSWMSLGSMLSMLGIIPGTILSGILANKFTKKKVYIAGFILAAVAVLLRLIALKSIPLLCASMLIYGIGTGFIITLVYSIQADNTDYINSQKEIRAEAAVASLSSFATKAGAGIGGAIPGYILAAVGYQAAMETQPANVITAIVVASIIIPSALYVLGGFIFKWKYKLDGCISENAIN